MWFNIMATRNRRLHRTLNVLCVLFAVTIPITSFFSAILLAKMVTAILGAMIAFLLMLSLFGNYQVKHYVTETWRSNWSASAANI